MARKIRKKKWSWRQSEKRRRWKDLQDTKREKYSGRWKRRDRRRKAFQVMRHRKQIVTCYQSLRSQGQSEEHAAHIAGERFGCSKSSVRNYYRSWTRGGMRGLMPSVTVRAYPSRTPWSVIQLIMFFRRVFHWGGDRIAAELKSRQLYHMSGQGVYNLFKRYRVYTRTYRPVGVRKGIRYKQWKVNEVNDVWHVDFAGPFVTAEGKKCWVLLAVDAHSRMLLTATVVESLATQTVLEILGDLFEEHGRPKMLVTDNGMTFTSVWEDGAHAFTDFLTARGIEHYRIPPYYPEANGKAEAAVKIVKREALCPFLKASPDWNPGQLQQLLTRFRTYYNSARLHSGIGWRTPAQRWFTKGDMPPEGMENLFFINEPELQFVFC